MAYKQSPASVLKGQMKNKAVGLAHGDSMAMQLKEPKTGKRKVQPFVDPGPDPSQGFTDDSAPYDLTSEGGTKGQYNPEAPSKKFFKSQDVVNKAVQTLEDIEGGKTPYTGYANAASTVSQALLGDKTRKDRLTTGQLKSLAKSDPVKGMEYISRNIRTAKLGDARSQFDKSYNPFKKS